MHHTRTLISALLVATACSPALAAVVCEFEPTLDFDDCRSCYKADQEGVRLYLGGKLQATSTSPLRAPTLPIDGRSYSRGVEKTMISERSGRFRVFEYCYEKETPVVASSFELRMDEADFAEFSLDGTSAESGIKFVLAGKVSSGTASFFGDKLAFLPDGNWPGYAEIPYRLILQDGRVSAPGVIVVKSPGYGGVNPLAVAHDPNVVATPAHIPDPITPADIKAQSAVAEAKAKEERDRLVSDLELLTAQLEQEIAIGDSTKKTTMQVESEMDSLKKRLELVNHEIAKLVAIRNHLALAGKQEIYTQPTDWVDQVAVADVVTVSSLLHVIPQAVTPRPSEPPAFIRHEPCVVTRVGPWARPIQPPAAGEPDRRNKAELVLRPLTKNEAVTVRRRMTKAEKKRLKKQRNPSKEKGPDAIRALGRIAA